MSLPYYLITEIPKLNHLYPYKKQIQDDTDQRIQFCEEVTDKLPITPK